jgi:ABC-type uncharacterized transport system, permease component
MTETAFRGAIELGLIYGLVAMGLFLSYKILNLADLTVDGSFALGAVVSIMLTSAGIPWLGIAGSFVFGGVAGFITAFLQTKLKIQSILAGILTMSALYSINLKIMGGRASVNTINQETIFTGFIEQFGSIGKILPAAIITLSLAILTVLFLNTQIGLSVRATGDNENMVKSSSINSDVTKTIGLVLANALVGLSGGILAQYQQSAEINIGTGVVVTGLAALIIGEVIFGNLIFAITKTRNVITGMISVLLGAIIYRIIIALVLQYNNLPALKALNITASDMKLLSSIIVIIAISYPTVQESLKIFRQKRSLATEKRS